MQLFRHVRHATAATTLRRNMVLFLLLALPGLMIGCGRGMSLSAASDPRIGACDNGLLAVGAWKCLSGGLQAADLSADPAATGIGRDARPTGKAAVETARQ